MKGIKSSSPAKLIQLSFDDQLKILCIMTSMYVYNLQHKCLLSAVVLFLFIGKSCTVKGTSDGKDEIRVKITDPSDSPTDVLLVNNRTPNTTIYQ